MVNVRLPLQSVFSVTSSQLKLTLHNSSFLNASGEDKEIIDTIRKFSSLPRVETFDFDGEGSSKTEVAEKFKDRHLPPDEIAVHDHRALNRDIFVTCSGELLRKFSDSEYANVCSPQEALSLLGLYLRKNDQLVIRVEGGTTFSIPKSYFYEALVINRMPSVMNYMASSQSFPENSRDQLQRFGWSAFAKCQRAIQARDRMAFSFYSGVSDEASEELLYHFDYLTLLLVGAFDSIVNVVRLFFRLDVPEYSGFRSERFQKQLNSIINDDVKRILLSDRCKEHIAMLHPLRNSIHNLWPTRTTSFGSGKSFYITPRIGKDDLELVFKISSGHEDWANSGVTKAKYTAYDSNEKTKRAVENINIEPFLFGSRILNNWLSLLDDIVASMGLEISDKAKISESELNYRKWIASFDY